MAPSIGNLSLCLILIVKVVAFQFCSLCRHYSLVTRQICHRLHSLPFREKENVTSESKSEGLFLCVYVHLCYNIPVLETL